VSSTACIASDDPSLIYTSANVKKIDLSFRTHLAASFVRSISWGTTPTLTSSSPWRKRVWSFGGLPARRAASLATSTTSPPLLQGSCARSIRSRRLKLRLLNRMLQPTPLCPLAVKAVGLQPRRHRLRQRPGGRNRRSQRRVARRKAVDRARRSGRRGQPQASQVERAQNHLP